MTTLWILKKIPITDPEWLTLLRMEHRAGPFFSFFFAQDVCMTLYFSGTQRPIDILRLTNYALKGNVLTQNDETPQEIRDLPDSLAMKSGRTTYATAADVFRLDSFRSTQHHRSEDVINILPGQNQHMICVVETTIHEQRRWHSWSSRILCPYWIRTISNSWWQLLLVRCVEVTKTAWCRSSHLLGRSNYADGPGI